MIQKKLNLKVNINKDQNFDSLYLLKLLLIHHINYAKKKVF